VPAGVLLSDRDADEHVVQLRHGQVLHGRRERVQRLPWWPVWLVPASDVGAVFWLVRGGLRVPKQLDVGDGGSMWPRAVQRCGCGGLQ
jgi:hypothetical protein